MMKAKTAPSLSEKLQKHIYHYKPLLNRQALFSDDGPGYMDPPEPAPGETVRLTLRTARHNVDHAYVCLDGVTVEMTLVRHTDLFDYYQASCQAGSDPVFYEYKVTAGADTLYYNQLGPRTEQETDFRFRIVPGFSTPDWAKGAVMYQIFVDRFANGDPSNDVLDHEYVYISEHVTRVTDWHKYPAAMGVREFYGGDLQGILNHLDYLQDLGVDVLYLNPIFVSPSNHKYDIQDYDYIDPHYTVIPVDEGDLLPDWASDNTHAGRYIKRVTDKRNLEASNRFFVHFIEEVHKRGMRVILDGVFNHCGSFNKWMDAERIYEYQQDYAKGAYVSENSPYHDFFRFYEGGSWPYNDDYDGWWGHNTLPKLNYEGSRRLYDYIMQIGKKWVSPPFNADGWRLDVAADLGHSPETNHRFWRDFRRAVKEANPDAIILAEHYGDPSDWLKGDQWDTVMNYNAFMEPITWYLTGMEKHSDEKREDLQANGQAFFEAMAYHMSKLHYPSRAVSMNELSNHDHSRFMTRTAMKVGRTLTQGSEAAGQGVNPALMRAAVLMQMTWPGAPTLYYGDEAGQVGWTDPDNRRTYPWGREDRDLIRFHKEMIRLHKSCQPLIRGSLKHLIHISGAIAYGRFTEEEKMVILVNAGIEEVKLAVPVWEIGVTDGEYMQQLMFTWSAGYSMRPVCREVEAGFMPITITGQAAMLLTAVSR